jgi:hypothetical protein
MACFDLVRRLRQRVSGQHVRSPLLTIRTTLTPSVTTLACHARRCSAEAPPRRPKEESTRRVNSPTDERARAIPGAMRDHRSCWSSSTPPFSSRTDSCSRTTCGSFLSASRGGRLRVGVADVTLREVVNKVRETAADAPDRSPAAARLWRSCASIQHASLDLPSQSAAEQSQGSRNLWALGRAWELCSAQCSGSAGEEFVRSISDQPRSLLDDEVADPVGELERHVVAVGLEPPEKRRAYRPIAGAVEEQRWRL